MTPINMITRETFFCIYGNRYGKKYINVRHKKPHQHILADLEDMQQWRCFLLTDEEIIEHIVKESI